MPHARWPLTALGLALAGVAGVGLSLRRAPVVGAPGSLASAMPDAHHFHGPLKPPAPGTGRWQSDTESLTASDAPVPPSPLARYPTAAGATTAMTAPALSEEAVWSRYQPSPEELAYRAHKVEQEANAELRKMLHVLELDEAQQDRVFATLVRSSTYFHPALQPLRADGASIVPNGPSSPAPEASSAPPAAAEGTGPMSSPATAAPTDPVLAELTPEQADVYERYTSERDAFWAGVVEDIETEINTSP